MVSNTVCGTGFTASSRDGARVVRGGGWRTPPPATNCYTTEPRGFVDCHHGRNVVGFTSASSTTGASQPRSATGPGGPTCVLPTHRNGGHRTSNPGRGSEGPARRIRTWVRRQASGEGPHSLRSNRYRPDYTLALCGKVGAIVAVSRARNHRNRLASPSRWMLSDRRVSSSSRLSDSSCSNGVVQTDEIPVWLISLRPHYILTMIWLS